MTGRVRLEADVVTDTKHLGGRDQYSAEDYGWWAEQLGEALEPGTFGENLTLSSFGAEPVKIGDRFRVGEVLLEAPVAKRTRRAWERWLRASFRRDSEVEHSAHSA